MSEEIKKSPIRGEIRLSWKDALAEAWKKRSRRHLLMAALVLSILVIFNIFQDDVHISPLRWAAIGALLLIINVGDDARLQRKASRNLWWIDPTVKANNVR